MTTPVPSAIRAKKSGACRRDRPFPSRQRSQNGCDDDRRDVRVEVQQHQVITYPNNTESNCDYY